MIAYKFLRPGAIGRFSGFEWPAGTWVEAEPRVCTSGIHACRVEDLPYWIDAELWAIELEGAIPAARKLVARRGRLLERIAGWDAGAARAFAESCASVVAALEVVPELAADAARAAASGQAAAASFVAARAAERVGGLSAYEAERQRQAHWLAEHLALLA